jgi:hypothetical protein
MEYHFEDTILKTLFNVKAWFNLTSSEPDLLETLDVSLLRKLLKDPKGTPKKKFPAQVSAESPSNISPNPSEVISQVSEP